MDNLEYSEDRRYIHDIDNDSTLKDDASRDMKNTSSNFKDKDPAQFFDKIDHLTMLWVNQIKTTVSGK